MMKLNPLQVTIDTLLSQKQMLAEITGDASITRGINFRRLRAIAVLVVVLGRFLVFARLRLIFIATHTVIPNTHVNFTFFLVLQ